MSIEAETQHCSECKRRGCFTRNKDYKDIFEGTFHSSYTCKCGHEIDDQITEAEYHERGDYE